MLLLSRIFPTLYLFASHVVRPTVIPPSFFHDWAYPLSGKEVRRVAAANSQGESVKRGRREAEKDVHGPRCDRRARVGLRRLRSYLQGMRLGLGAMSPSYIVHSTLMVILLPRLLSCVRFHPVSALLALSRRLR